MPRSWAGGSRDPPESRGGLGRPRVPPDRRVRLVVQVPERGATRWRRLLLGTLLPAGLASRPGAGGEYTGPWGSAGVSSSSPSLVRARGCCCQGGGAHHPAGQRTSLCSARPSCPRGLAADAPPSPGAPANCPGKGRPPSLFRPPSRVQRPCSHPTPAPPSQSAGPARRPPSGRPVGPCGPVPRQSCPCHRPLRLPGRREPPSSASPLWPPWPLDLPRTPGWTPPCASSRAGAPASPGRGLPCEPGPAPTEAALTNPLPSVPLGLWASVGASFRGPSVGGARLPQTPGGSPPPGAGGPHLAPALWPAGLPPRPGLGVLCLSPRESVLGG